MISRSTILLGAASAWLVSLGAAYWAGSRHVAQHPAPEADPSSSTPGVSDVLVLTPARENQPAPPISRSRQERDEAFRRRAQGMDLNQTQVALTELGTPRDPAAVAWHKALMRQWASMDPRGALLHAHTLTQPKLRYDAQATALEEWAKSNPSHAWTYATTNPDGGLSEEMHDHVIEGIAQADPQTALRFMKTHAESLLGREDGVESLISELILNGSREQVTEEIRRLAPGPLRDAAAHALVREWSRYDPEAALRWVERAQTESPLPLDAKQDTYCDLVRGWSRVDPLKAIEWVRSLPPEEQAPAYLKDAFSTWMRIDEVNAANWLLLQEDSPATDPLIEHYARIVVDRDPAGTMRWAESISDPARREAVMRRVGYVWEDIDPDGWKSYSGEVVAPANPH